MRLGDLDELKKHAIEVYQGNGVELVPIMMVPVSAIDNTPTVPLPDFKEGYKQAIIDGKTNFQRPQGEWEKPFLHSDDRWYHKCTNCHICSEISILQDKYCNFCPNCGADMRGDKE